MRENDTVNRNINHINLGNMRCKNHANLQHFYLNYIPDAEKLLKLANKLITNISIFHGNHLNN